MMENVIRWRYVCTPANESARFHVKYKRAPRYPGVQQVTATLVDIWILEV